MDDRAPSASRAPDAPGAAAPGEPGRSRGADAGGDGAPDRPWSRDAEDVARALGTDPEQGLATDEAQRRLREHGPNRLREHRRRGPGEILIAQFRSVVVALLAGAALLSFAFAGPVEGVAILVVLVLNAAIGFFTELRAVRSMEALRELGDVTVTVRRGGSTRRAPARELVPGDVVVLEGGDVVAADVRLVEASRLQADESALTGESVPVEKDPGPVAGDAPLAERSSMVFKGTSVTRGSGRGVVVGTGMATELGRISELVEEAGDEETPLERRLTRLGRRLVWVTLGLAAVITATGAATGRDLFLIVETAIALAVAAIPEGLPVVATLALARGMWRMARRNALVEKLSAVETLGSTTVILTDKTGTLTENRMEVDRLVLPAGEVPVKDDRPAADPSGRTDVAAALRVGVLCNHAPAAADPGTDGSGAGDPMERALLRLGRASGAERREVLERHPEVRQVAFDPSVAAMATYHGDGDGVLVAVKGAPESVLEAATRIRRDEETVPLETEEREGWLARADELADQGYRLLALAEKRVPEPEAPPYEELVFLGLVAFVDPPRADVREAVASCRAAGVRVVMVTGDHPGTARTVARAVGVGGEDEAAVTGSEVLPPDRLDPRERRRLREASVFARTTPEQKLDLLALHREAGEVVAMIGDGVNDAPALQAADIGVAMGRRGTQVAREASDVVLEDDRFGTIVEAIRQGRVIFDNIRKFVVYLLSCNGSEVLAVSLATLAGAPLPLLPLQILFLNLVTDVFPALALGFGEGDASVLRRPPREPDEPVLTGRHWRGIAAHSLVMTAAVLAGLAIALGPLGMETAGAVTVSFLVLALAQLFHVFNMAGARAGVAVNDVTRNPWVWGALALCLVLLLGASYLPGPAAVLKIRPPDARGWALVLGLALVPLAAGRAWRLLAGAAGVGGAPAGGSVSRPGPGAGETS